MKPAIAVSLTDVIIRPSLPRVTWLLKTRPRSQINTDNAAQLLVLSKRRTQVAFQVCDRHRALSKQSVYSCVVLIIILLTAQVVIGAPIRASETMCTNFESLVVASGGGNIGIAGNLALIRGRAYWGRRRRTATRLQKRCDTLLQAAK